MEWNMEWSGVRLFNSKNERLRVMMKIKMPKNLMIENPFGNVVRCTCIYPSNTHTEKKKKTKHKEKLQI